MITGVPRDPQPGMGLSADWGRAITQGVRAARVLPGLGIKVDESPDGWIVSLRRSLPGTTAAVTAGPWAVSFAGSAGAITATFTDCVFKRDSFTLVGTSSGATAGTVVFAMPTVSADSVRYLGFAYNAQTHAVEIISGTTLSSVSESAMPEADIELIRTPLYKVIFSGGAWRVMLSYLALPSVGLYN